VLVATPPNRGIGFLWLGVNLVVTVAGLLAMFFPVRFSRVMNALPVMNVWRTPRLARLIGFVSFTIGGFFVVIGVTIIVTASS
jgi:hypothetical protein